MRFSNMIINGYAFTKDSENIRVLNLNNPEMAIVFDKDRKVIETSMSGYRDSYCKGILIKQH